MAAIPKGAKVRQIAKPIEGRIASSEGEPATRFNESTGKLEYHVEFDGADGEQHFRWFAEDEIEATGDAS